MKRSAVLMLAVSVLILGGCAVFQPEETTTAEHPDDVATTAIIIFPETTAAFIAETEITADVYVSEEQTSEAPSETTTGISEATTAAEAEKTTAPGEKTTWEEKTTKEEQTTREEQTTSPEIPDEVDLSISMPEKNGTMETDSSPDNKYIRIVNNKKKIDTALLLAVYSVPESGQNYVFEFYDADNFTADNIRRVYLIDSYGDITSVAAAESSEKENISPVENWFCMNVLIKEIIYPAVSQGE